jgi:hypothetical protein
MAAEISDAKERGMAIEMPIEVSGFDRNGKFFTLRAVTDEATRTGCRFRLPIEIDHTSILAIRAMARGTGLRDSATPVLFHVSGLEKDGNRWVLSAAAVQPEPSGGTGLRSAHGGAHSSV